MDNQQKLYGDEDAMLVDVPISIITPQQSKVDNLENMDMQHKGDDENVVAAVPISSIASEDNVLEYMDTQHRVDKEDPIAAIPLSYVAPQVDVLENMDKQHKVDDDKDVVLMKVPIYFMAPDESKVDVLEKMDKHHKVDCVDAIMAVPISSVAPQASVSLNMDNQQRVGDNEDATLMEVPISFIALEKAKVDVLQNEMTIKNMHYMHTHTFEQRRQNWIIKNISRPGGSIIDYVYHHLETNKKFRSLVEVYKFVVYGEVPEITKKLQENEETVQVTPRRKPPVYGKKLIKSYVVGTCTESCNGVYIKNRGEANYLSERDIPSNIERKRKREKDDLYGHQQVNLGDDATRVNSGDAAFSTPVQSFLYLWDFELIPEAHNEKHS